MTTQLGYTWRRLTPAQDEAILSARNAGVPRATLAAEYGVTERSITRAMIRAASEDLRRVNLGGYMAVFALTEDGPPRQVTSWVPAP